MFHDGKKSHFYSVFTLNFKKNYSCIHKMSSKRKKINLKIYKPTHEYHMLRVEDE